MPKIQNHEAGATFSADGRAFEQMPIQLVSSPGCYVDSRYGSLYRVTPQMLSIGGTVIYGISPGEPWYVTRISDDYSLPLDEARMIAANASLKVRF